MTPFSLRGPRPVLDETLPTEAQLLHMVIEAGGQLKVSYTQPDPEKVSKASSNLHMGEVSVWLPEETLKDVYRTPQGKGLRISKSYADSPGAANSYRLGKGNWVLMSHQRAVALVYAAVEERLK